MEDRLRRSAPAPAVAYEKELAPGEYLEVDLPLHYSWENGLERQERDQHCGDGEEMAESDPHSRPQCSGANVIRLDRAGVD
jgi:hypothetical protein